MNDARLDGIPLIVEARRTPFASAACSVRTSVLLHGPLSWFYMVPAPEEERR